MSEELSKDQVVSGEIVEPVDSELVPVHDPDTGLSIPLGSLMFSNPAAVITAVREVAVELVKVVDQLKLFKPINGKKFVYVDGWELLGGMLGVSAHEESTKRWDDGTWEAVVVLKRTRDQAIVGRASAICGIDESRWSSADEYARKSMAITRATGKAYRLAYSWIVRLAGYEATPAEEMTDEEESAKKEPVTGKRPVDRPNRPSENPKAVYKAYAMQLMDITPEEAKVEIQKMQQEKDFSFNVSQWEKMCKYLEDWSVQYRERAQKQSEAEATEIPAENTQTSVGSDPTETK